MTRRLPEGLLAALSKDDAEQAAKRLNTLETPAKIIGEVVERQDTAIIFKGE